MGKATNTKGERYMMFVRDAKTQLLHVFDSVTPEGRLLGGLLVDNGEDRCHIKIYHIDKNGVATLMDERIGDNYETWKRYWGKKWRKETI